MLLGKHCWRALMQTVCMISYCGLWHSKRSILRNHSLSCCVCVQDINPNWFLFFNFILKCTISDLSPFCNPILIKTKRQDSDCREMNKSASLKTVSYYYFKDRQLLKCLDKWRTQPANQTGSLALGAYGPELLPLKWSHRNLWTGVSRLFSSSPRTWHCVRHIVLWWNLFCQLTRWLLLERPKKKKKNLEPVKALGIL